MLADSEDWVQIPNDNLRTETEGKKCLERYSGENCTDYCDKDCNMHGDCVYVNGASTCQCFDGYTGSNCQNVGAIGMMAVLLSAEDTKAVVLPIVAVAALVAVVAVGVLIRKRSRREQELGN
jgi:hypothetical protein